MAPKAICVDFDLHISVCSLYSGVQDRSVGTDSTSEIFSATVNLFLVCLSFATFLPQSGAAVYIISRGVSNSSRET